MTDYRRVLKPLAEAVSNRPVFELAARLGPPGGVFVVGGAIRDCLLGRPAQPAGPAEIDLAVAAGAKGLGRRLAEKTGGRLVVLSEADDAVRLVMGDLIVDLTGFRGPDLESDLCGRDYTVNALALNLDRLLAGEIEPIDPLTGLSDLEARRLVPAGSHVLAADPLRVLRGFRLAAELGLGLPPATLRAMAAAAPGLRRVAGERINHELRRLLAAPRSADWLMLMAERKILGFVLPEAAALAGMYQNRYHHLDGLGHTLAALARLEDLLLRPPDWAKGREPDEAGRLITKLAVLFHDVGKLERFTVRPSGGLSFPRHDKSSVELWTRAAERLRFSRNETKAAAALIAAHMRPLSLLLAKQITAKAQRRLIKAAEGRLIELGLLVKADSLATRGPSREPAWEKRIDDLWRRLLAVEAEMGRQDEAPLIRGDELMAALGLAAGPLIGRLLTELAEARLAGRIADRDQALAWARQRLAELGPKEGGA